MTRNNRSYILYALYVLFLMALVLLGAARMEIGFALLITYGLGVVAGFALGVLEGLTNHFKWKWCFIVYVFLWQELITLILNGGPYMGMIMPYWLVIYIAPVTLGMLIGSGILWIKKWKKVEE